VGVEVEVEVEVVAVSLHYPREYQNYKEILQKARRLAYNPYR
jgi:hypothetical protein